MSGIDDSVCLHSSAKSSRFSTVTVWQTHGSSRRLADSFRLAFLIGIFSSSFPIVPYIIREHTVSATMHKEKAGPKKRAQITRYGRSAEREYPTTALSSSATYPTREPGPGGDRRAFLQRHAILRKTFWI